jgi:predicted naringenin-chalcone synthase
MYASSMSNLPKAMDAFAHSFLYDGSGQEMVLQLQSQGGQIVLAETPLASWIERGLEVFKALQREPR